MSTLDIINVLGNYFKLLTSIEEIETADRERRGEAIPEFSKAVSMSYSFIKLELAIREIQVEKQRHLISPYLKCTFEVDQQKVSCTEIYCVKKERGLDIETFISNQPSLTDPVDEKTMENRLDPAIRRYVAVADAIAQKGYLCSSGDGYRPGYYSEIRLQENSIVLRQINHWNSKSLNHKTDYHLRDLEFFIPLHPIECKAGIHEYKIGKMIIDFSDRSSKNNKPCGDQILQKITEEKLQFEM